MFSESTRDYEDESVDAHFEDQTMVASDILDEYQQHYNDLNYHQEWDIVPAGRLIKIWNDWVKMGFVRDVKGLNSIAELIVRNINKLEVNAILCGHHDYGGDPVEYAQDNLGVTLPKDYFERDDSFFTDEKGQYRFSDCAMKRLTTKALELRSAKSAEQKLQIIDRILNIVHPRSDLASWFVEGGSKTLSRLSGMGKTSSESMKTGYVSPPKGQLSLTVIHDAHPTVLMTLDLGIPNFTVFSLKYPLVDDEKRAMSELTAEALNALNDDVITFMLSMGYAEEVCVQICATVLTCFKNFSSKNDTQANLPMVGHDDSIVTYEGEFVMPQIFVDETYDKVVTAATIIKRLPIVRHLELTHVPPTKNTMSDAARAVKLFRGVSLTNQPQPLYVMVYDQKGRSRGVLPMTPNFKNQVLQNLRKR
jgi:hypothetical protein